MEYLPGETLERRISRHGPPRGDMLRQILEQMFHGVRAAHRAGIVHRDLKPANIYFANSLRPDVPFTIKVLDFGIAKMRGTSAGTLAMGTKAWMAPEQERSGSSISPAADVWALGLIVFWLLTGKSFWKNFAGTDSALSYEIFFDALPAASTRASELGSEPSIDIDFDNGAPEPFSGDQVMGTNLAGNYIDNNGEPAIETRARLVSPEFLIDEQFPAPALSHGVLARSVAG